MAQYRIQFGNLPKIGWRAWLALGVTMAIGLAAAIALIVVSLGVALILLPVVAIALVIGRWRLARLMAETRQSRQQPDAGRTIEIDYRVIDKDERR